MKKVDLSIILISYNTKELTCDAINSIVNTVKKYTFEIIVVDNDSQDGSAEPMKQLQKELEQKSIRFVLIENKMNKGFSKANNQGVGQANGRYVLFLNTDTLVYEDTLDGMVEFMDATPDAGASTCYVQLPNGKLDEGSHRGFPTPWRAFAHFSGLSKLFPNVPVFTGYLLSHLDLSTTHEVDALVGAFMLTRFEAGEQVGWWDEDYFWYGDDLDFCYRLKKAGWKIYFVPQYKILHYKGVSGGIKKISSHITKASRKTKLRATDARFDAMRIFYNKHYKQKYPAIIHFVVLSGIQLKWRLQKLFIK